jgi:predicted aconitase with swiveling domain
LTLKTIVKGKVSGKVLKSNQPINFLGSVDKKTGAITDQKHDLFGKKIADSILVFPNGIGSSVGAYTIYSLKSNNSAPAAMACQKVDLTVASGCALANIPLFILSSDEYDSMKDGDEISLG